MSLYTLKGTSGSVVNQSFPLTDTFVLGASDDCDVQIQGPGIAPHHAKITLVDGNALRLTDLGSSYGTLLNGEPVQQAMLGSGDEIRIGSCRWMLQAPGLRPQRVLTDDVIAKSNRLWPRVVIWTVLGATAAAVAVIKFRPEWIAAWWP